MSVSLKRRLGLAGVGVVVATALYGISPACAADDDEAVENWVSASDFGGVGLLQTRTARFAADGTVDIGASFIEPYKRFYFNLQAVPWLEGTFRYSEITNKLYSQFTSFSGGQTFKDRGADLKFRLAQESRYWPAVALLLQDGLGTGQFSGEALVASKRYLDLDFSFGLGWGYMARRGNIKNPVISLSKGFSGRGGSSARTGGQFNLKSYFTGETIAPFGGVAYRSPIRGLTFKLELDSNDYQLEPEGNKFVQNTPFNFGLNYRPFSWFDLSLAYERGNSLMFRASARANLNTDQMPKFDPPPQTIGPRPKRKSFGATPSAPEVENQETPSPLAMPASGDPGEQDAPPLSPARTSEEIAVALLDGLGAEGLQLESIHFSGDETTIGVTGELQAMPEAAVMRAARVVSGSISRAAKRISFVQASADGEAVRRSVSRDEAEARKEVDYFFEQVEKQGIEVLWVAINQQNAELGVRRTAAASDVDEAGLATLMFLSLPVPARDVKVVTLGDPVAPSKTSAEGSEVRSSINIAESSIGLGPGLGPLGLELRSIELLDNRRIVRFRRARRADENQRLLARGGFNGVMASRDEEISLIGPDAQSTTAGGPQSCTEDPCASSGAENLALEDIVYGDQEKRQVAKRVIRTIRRSGYIVHAFHLSGSQATVFVTVGNYPTEAQRIGRAARLLANSVPEPVEKLTIVAMNGGLESYRITLNRNDLEKAANHQGTIEEVWRRARIEKPRPFGIPDDAIRNPKAFPRFLWSFGPRTRQHVGGPDQFMLYQFWASLNANLAIAPGLGVSAGVGKNLYHNFDKIKLSSDSVLPHVRSDIKHYLQQGTDNLTRLNASYFFMPFEDFYFRTSAGYFEEMYGGFSTEFLYRPFDSRFAFGFDINRVWKREFEQRLGFLDYRVTTGHVNLYYHFPFYELLGEVNIGQYLAEDRGVTFNISRRFDNGVRVGMWATFTDVSAEQFGEGSFDKGIFTSIPFHVFLPISTTAHGNFGFRPLTRDGGQRLAVGGRLYDVSNNATLDAVVHKWDTLLD